MHCYVRECGPCGPCTTVVRGAFCSLCGVGLRLVQALPRRLTDGRQDDGGLHRTDAYVSLARCTYCMTCTLSRV